MRVLFLTKYPFEGASSRYRVYQYLPFVAAAGIEYEVDPFISPAGYRLSLRPGRTWAKLAQFALSLARRLSWIWRCRPYDLVFMQRESLPIGPPVMERWFRFTGKTTVFDYDDALFLFKPNARFPLANRLKRPDRLNQIFGVVDCVLSGNGWLRDKAAQYCDDSRTFPVAEDLTRYTMRDPGRDDTVVIGWLGSPSTEKYLEIVRDVLRDLARQYPNLLLRIVGGGSFHDSQLRVEHVRWSFETEVSALHSFDVGIMPLPLEDWSMGKSGGKARTYMAVGLPVVCTGIGFNTELIEHRKTGFLVRADEEWREALSTLIGDADLRRSVGIAARRRVEERYSLARLGPEFVEVLRDIHQVATARRSRERR